MNQELRKYQRAALDAVREHYRLGERRMLLVCPTGSGKTLIFSRIAEWLGLGDQLVLILAHRDELVAQARAKYVAANPSAMVGIEKGVSYAAVTDKVIVASVQSLRGARLKQLLARCGRPALIITDEAHHAASASYQAIYKACGVTRHGTVVHVGVTATPQRTDRVGLQATYDKVAYSIDLRQLIKEGYLSPIRGHRVMTQTSLDRVHIRAGDLDAFELGVTVNNPERNAAVVAAYLSVASDRKALVFAASIEHSIALTEAFVAAGQSARHLDGSTPLPERRTILDAFANSEIKVLVNCAVLIEGYDEPSIDAIILARPTKSALLMTQMIGRGTRTHPGKSHLIVVDMVDVTSRHSIVTLPTILGLPAKFSLRGRDLQKTAEKWAALAEESPEAIPVVMDALTLAKAMRMSATSRFTFIQALIADAKRSQVLVDFDVFSPPSLPKYIQDHTTLVWSVVGHNSYRLRVRNEQITVTGDAAGKYSVLVIDGKKSSPVFLEEYDDVLAAFSVAEQRARDVAQEQVAHIERFSPWRKEQSTIAQREYIESFGITIRRSTRLSRGAASGIIRALQDG